MDDFKKAGVKSIGPGGIKCNCCFDWHWFGQHQKKLKGFSKLRRSRMNHSLKQKIQKNEG